MLMNTSVGYRNFESVDIKLPSEFRLFLGQKYWLLLGKIEN